VRAALQPIGLATSEIQQFGTTNEFLIRADRSQHGDRTADTMLEALRSGLPGSTVEARRTEDVGPKVGSELKVGAAKALLLGLLCILIYVGVRYEFRFAGSAVIVLFFDVLVVVGLLTLMGREFSLNVVAALLTVAGYCVNDTIIVFDRIREDMRLYRKETFEKIVDLSINQTLSRTIITSGLTFSTVVCLYLFGGEVIRDFALALGLGIAVGTLASIFVAAAILVDWRARAMAAADRKKAQAAA
jgi:preprotein translocase SecF subunit